jgi:hypothetical protein
MKASEFCYWLQGFFELRRAASQAADAPDGVKINAAQSAVIERHLNMVFHHDLDPKQGTPEHQEELQAIHDGLPHIPGVMRC